MIYITPLPAFAGFFPFKEEQYNDAGRIILMRPKYYGSIYKNEPALIHY